MSALEITIRLGNAEMQTGENIADALETIAARLREFYGSDDLREWHNLSGGVLDLNGNHVGRWVVAP